MFEREVINFERIRFSTHSLEQASLIRQKDMSVFFSGEKVCFMHPSLSNKTNLMNHG